MKKTIKKQRVFSWMNNNLDVCNALNYGKNEKGIFAKKNIKKDDIIAIFGGYIISAKDELKLPKEFRDHGVQIHEDFVLTIKKKSEIEDGGYFNHSCDPNSGYKGQIFLVAMRNIKKGEEITFDYAMVLHKTRGRREYKIKCLCGSMKCRGFVSDYDWKKPELQERYDGYFQWYLQDKINKNK